MVEEIGGCGAKGSTKILGRCSFDESNTPKTSFFLLHIQPPISSSSAAPRTTYLLERIAAQSGLPLARLRRPFLLAVRHSLQAASALTSSVGWLLAFLVCTPINPRTVLSSEYSSCGISRNSHGWAVLIVLLIRGYEGYDADAMLSR